VLLSYSSIVKKACDCDVTGLLILYTQADIWICLVIYYSHICMVLRYQLYNLITCHYSFI